ncbi:amidohydrolase family protein, partial [Gammaproteobacteria bacterium AH-315-E17]|nr:amidohydrolase family protein [Gammaproteobacteria bacterium AH-315-E17]
THLNGVPGMFFEHEQAYPDIAKHAQEQFPKSYLYYGFTTVIDLMSNSELIASWNDQEIRPQAYFCGAAPIVDGYPMSNIPQPLRYQVMPYFLFDELRAEQFPEDIDPLEHTPAAVVRKMKAEGAICVKSHYETGFGAQKDLPTPTIGLIQELVNSAHEMDIPVLLHANSQSAQNFGVLTGVDAIVHGLWTWDDPSAIELNEEVTQILDGIIEQGIGWQPTIQVLYGERDLHDPNYLSQAELKNALPQSLIEWYATEDGQWFRNRMANLPFVARLLESDAWEELDAVPIARVNNAFSYLSKNGGLLLFGSDTPSDVTFANPPGFNGRLEMQRWQEAGITPIQFFQAATIKNAELFGLQNKIGTVEVGKQADLLLLSEDPTKDIGAFDSIEMVILSGKVLDRASLSARVIE